MRFEFSGRLQVVTGTNPIELFSFSSKEPRIRRNAEPIPATPARHSRIELKRSYDILSNFSFVKKEKKNPRLRCRKLPVQSKDSRAGNCNAAVKARPAGRNSERRRTVSDD